MNRVAIKPEMLRWARACLVRVGHARSLDRPLLTAVFGSGERICVSLRLARGSTRVAWTLRSYEEGAR